MTMPPMILTQGLLVIAAPTRPAVVPRIRKMVESPALKASELMITARRLLVPSFSPSTLTPEIREIYPGTNGRTHGDRNDAMPAIKAIRIRTMSTFIKSIADFQLPIADFVDRLALNNRKSAIGNRQSAIYLF
jgi:hypothetical protein